MKIMTRINGELCERVDSAGSLKQMDVVYGGPCIRCQKMHRGTLLKDGDWMVRLGVTSGGEVVKALWELQPQPGCSPMLRIYVSDGDVRRGAVWRVVDEAAIDDAIRATETKLRQRELVTV